MRTSLSDVTAEVGFSFLLNISGKLYTATRSSLKDVSGNARVLHLQFLELPTSTSIHYMLYMLSCFSGCLDIYRVVLL